MKKINIAVFHYHFLPGGVTTVAALSLRAVMQYGRDSGITVGKIALICGRKENTEQLMLKEIIPFAGSSIEVEAVIIPEMDYLPQTGFDKYSISSAIQSRLENFKGWIWWIHNYQLGKNPLFTSVIVDYLVKNNDQKALLHIHDFPECARPDNYKFLTGFIRDIYPVYSNIRYITINSRDACYLTVSGIPEKMVYLLSDPVPDAISGESRECEENKSRNKKMLSDKFSGFFPGFNSEKPFGLYPVRTIRRKNILEAGLLASLTGDNGECGFNLIVTLPGISRQEKKYSDTVQSCFEEGLIPGIWGCGSSIYGREAGFDEVIEASDFIISSSVMEGFGYLFIDSLRWGKPLAARYLDIIEGFKEVFDNTASLFYDRIDVPVSQAEAENLKNAYFRNLDFYCSFLDISSINALREQIEIQFNSKITDFSFFSAAEQKLMLKKISIDRGFRDEVKNINQTAVRNIINIIHSKQNLEHEKIGQYFSLKSFAGIFSTIINSYDSPVIDESDDTFLNSNTDISANLLKLFLKPENMRLLITEH